MTLGAVFLSICVIFLKYYDRNMLGTLSLDDKFTFLGGHKVAASATKHLVDRADRFRSCALFTTSTGLRKPAAACHPLVHYLQTQDPPPPPPFFSPPFIFVPFFYFSTHNFSRLQCWTCSNVTSSVTLLGANTSGGRSQWSVYPQTNSALFQHTHPDTKLCQISSVSLSLNLYYYFF